MIHQGSEEKVRQMIEVLKNNKQYSTLFKNIKNVEKIIKQDNLIGAMYHLNK